jgi:hypothetical protein
MVSIFVLHPNILLNYLYCHLFCVEDPEEGSTAGVPLQLHRSGRCGPSCSTTGSRSRSFVGCGPPWKSTYTNSPES